MILSSEPWNLNCVGSLLVVEGGEGGVSMLGESDPWGDMYSILPQYLFPGATVAQTQS